MMIGFTSMRCEHCHFIPSERRWVCEAKSKFDPATREWKRCHCKTCEEITYTDSETRTLVLRCDPCGAWGKHGLCLYPRECPCLCHGQKAVK